MMRKVNSNVPLGVGEDMRVAVVRPHPQLGSTPIGKNQDLLCDLMYIEFLWVFKALVIFEKADRLFTGRRL
jgi:hypothetical protein